MPLYHACPVGAENRERRSVQGSLQAPADALAGFRRLKGIQDEGFGSCDRFSTSRWLSAPLLIEGEINSRSEPPTGPQSRCWKLQKGGEEGLEAAKAAIELDGRCHGGRPGLQVGQRVAAGKKARLLPPSLPSPGEGLQTEIDGHKEAPLGCN
ncbi:hypothetical protein NDA11_004114 [Ustilago hordei]|nr:hypothetical protein NDA15_005873 [Ustilago hordei]KAJ1578645.1 hypothetical protein NDA12_003670 [Ustilago hordei]KAJ1584087.1 hypothetical protein NDA11_004114 [Ustilago hordei]KAJ1599216.1 hypothetical protein NDA14_004513 [Ustilago hordei]